MSVYKINISWDEIKSKPYYAKKTIKRTKYGKYRAVLLQENDGVRYLYVRGKSGSLQGHTFQWKNSNNISLNRFFNDLMQHMICTTNGEGNKTRRNV